MTNLETNLLEVLTREAERFCSRAVRLFPAPLVQIRKDLTWDFILLFISYPKRYQPTNFPRLKGTTIR